MLRGENIACGTTTTGAGALTMAPCPSAVGGIDPYIAFSGMGFGTSQPVPITYVMTEFTDTNWTTQVRKEKGVGGLLLGSGGIATCTLTRTTVQVAIDLTAGTYNVKNPAPIAIQNAANVLIEIAPAAADLFNGLNNFTNANGFGCGPVGSFTSYSNVSLTNNRIQYYPFVLGAPVLAAVLRMNVGTAYSGGVSNLWGAICDKSLTTEGPGKLLANYGLLGTANASLNSTGVIASAALANPPLLLPGPYILVFEGSFSGGTGTPQLYYADKPITFGDFGVNNQLHVQDNAYVGGTGSVADFTDPAPISGISYQKVQHCPTFTLAAS